MKKKRSNFFLFYPVIQISLFPFLFLLCFDSRSHFISFKTPLLSYKFSYTRSFIAAIKTLRNAITCIINGYALARMAGKLKSAALRGTFIIINSYISRAGSTNSRRCYKEMKYKKRKKRA